MRPVHALLVIAIPGVVACGGGGEPGETAPADTAAQEEVMFVPDSTIEREVRTRFDADPRFDIEGFEVEVHADGGDVTLVGTVPTRRELQFAREVAISSPGVRRVYLDSLDVLSEPEPEPREREPEAAT